MHSRRNFIAILTLLFAVPMLAAGAWGAAFQGGQGGGGRRGMPSPDEQLKRMTKDLNLTADQQTKIKPILVDEEKKREDLRNDSSVDRQTMRQKMMQIRQDSSDQIRALLDDKQKETFDKQEQNRENRAQGRRGGPGGPGGDNSGGNAPPPPQN
jgi:Spy/CpxP family protein refolding chaperone